MIPRTLARKLFIAINNPWLCSINDNPKTMSKDFEKIFGGDIKITDRLQLHTTWDVITTDDHIFPRYNIEMRLEAIGTKTAIDLGKINELSVKDMELIMNIGNGTNNFTIKLPTDCEDLDAVSYRLKNKDFETRGRLT